jgi:hypothetical protein
LFISNSPHTGAVDDEALMMVLVSFCSPYTGAVGAEATMMVLVYFSYTGAVDASPRQETGRSACHP